MLRDLYPSLSHLPSQDSKTTWIGHVGPGKPPPSWRHVGPGNLYFQGIMSYVLFLYPTKHFPKSSYLSVLVKKPCVVHRGASSALRVADSASWGQTAHLCSHEDPSRVLHSKMASLHFSHEDPLVPQRHCSHVVTLCLHDLCNTNPTSTWAISSMGTDNKCMFSELSYQRNEWTVVRTMNNGNATSYYF